MILKYFHAALLLVPAFYAADVYAAGEGDYFVFNIPASSAGISLNVISKQSNTPVIFSYEKISGLRTQSVTGRYSLDEALERLLRGTGLLAHLTARGVITISQVEQSNEPLEDTVNLKTAQGLLLSTTSAATVALTPNIATAQNAQSPQEQTGFAIDEIVVTARRKSENVQDTPISITAVTGETLEQRGFQDVSQISKIAPNVVFDGAAPVSGNTAAPSVFIRGVGQLDFTVNNDPGVGIYVDDVYVSRSVGGVIDLLDLERVEVLRGPQGTLFGRNTIGGAIQLVSKKPSGEFGGHAEILVGSDDRVKVQGTIDVPLGNTLAVKASGSYHNRDGYVTNGINQDLGDDNTYTLRGQLLWEPTDNFSAYFVGDFTEDDENGAPNVALTAFPEGNFPARFNANPGRACGAPLPSGNTFADNQDIDTSAPDFQAYLDFINANPDTCFSENSITIEDGLTNSTTFALQQNEIFGVSGTLEYDFGNFTLKSTTAYRELDSQFQRDSDHTAFQIFDTSNDQQQDQFSQEFLLSGDIGPLGFVGGVYYFEESAVENTNIFLPALGGPINIRGIFDNQVDNENFAVFGEVNYDVTERLHLTGGLRFTDEDKSYATNQIFTFVTNPPGVGETFTGLTEFDNLSENPDGAPTLLTLVDDPGQTLSISELDYRVNVAYDFTDDFLGYFTTSTGFKSGGFNPRYLAPTPDLLAISFDPEFVELYEIGLKTNLLENRLQLNVAAFISDYTDIQLSANTEASAGATIVQNAADATIKGFEAEFQFLASSSVIINGALGLLDAEYGDGATAGLGFPCGDGCEFARIPEVTASWGVSYAHDTSFGTITPRLDYAYKSSVQGDVDNNAEIVHPEENIFNASVAFENNDQDWRFVAGISNLTNEEFFTSSNQNERLSYSEVIIGRGREWYASVRKTF